MAQTHPWLGTGAHQAEAVRAGVSRGPNGRDLGDDASDAVLSELDDRFTKDYLARLDEIAESREEET